MPPRDVSRRSWLGEDPSLEPLLDPAKKRAVEDLHLHAHVRAALLTKDLWTTAQVRAWLQVTPRTFKRVLAADAGLRALRIDLPREGDKPAPRWYAADVVNYYTQRPTRRRGKDDR